MVSRKIFRPDATQEWRNDIGDLHREDGPAYVSLDGTAYWYQHGWVHREDGPAIIRGDGTQEWWLNGKRYDEFEFRMMVAR
jgi:hypothetical protein